MTGWGRGWGWGLKVGVGAEEGDPGLGHYIGKVPEGVSTHPPPHSSGYSTHQCCTEHLIGHGEHQGVTHRDSCLNSPSKGGGEGVQGGRQPPPPKSYLIQNSRDRKTPSRIWMWPWSSVYRVGEVGEAPELPCSQQPLWGPHQVCSFGMKK